ncbi:MAG: hypothetical protein IPN97_12790 [Saprospiraceae bacterium]|nr:hypothetical protein [Saprospiraceae bacterium]
MVTVVNLAVRQNSEGNSYVALLLQGDLEMVQSKESGKFYATARKCAIASTFDEAFATSMVGKQIKGTIVKETCEPYEYVVPETGEQVTLAHRYVYSPEETEVTVSKQNNAPFINPVNFMGNGAVQFGEA